MKTIVVYAAALSLLTVPGLLRAQTDSVMDHVEALGLPTFSVGRVTVYFSVGDLERAEQLARLAEEAGAFYEKELGISFELGLAVLSPDDWLQRYGGDMPYGIPWYEDRVIIVPSSLQEGVLIGPDELESRHMVEFTVLHEFGHIASKAYFHPLSVHNEFPLPWFEELVASYFGYRFAHTSDRTRAESVRERSRSGVKGYTPKTLSLDWSFMGSLSGPEIADTYGWYQYMLNLRAIELHEQQGAAFLPALKAQLPLESLSDWTTGSLLEQLESIAPGFEQWVDELESGDVLKDED